MLDGPDAASAALLVEEATQTVTVATLSDVERRIEVIID